MEIKSKEIKIIPITEIKLNPKNRNHHPQEQIERLAELYKYQGMRNPVIISNRSGLLVCGHGRFLAAKRCGMKELPVIFQDFDSEDQEYSYAVSENAISSWAELDLSGINTDLQELGPDFDLNMLGIKDFTLEPMDKYENQDADAVPDVPTEPKSKLGDLYELGNHRLLCGDSTDKVTVEKLMNGEKADMVFTDPPYGMSVVKTDGMIGEERKGSVGWSVGTMDGKSQFHKAKVGVYKPIIGDDKPYDPTHLMDLAEIKIIWGANHFSDKLPCSPHWIVWNKEMPEGADFSGAELAWTNIEKKAVKVFKFTWAGMTRQGDRKDELTKRVHPTQKPVGLFVDILNHYEPKSLIDVFGGSGSTLIACEKTNRKCFMCELDPHYIQVIIERYIKFTGRDDVYLINDDGSKTKWSDISEKR